jgi:hypothetical protein
VKLSIPGRPAANDVPLDSAKPSSAALLLIRLFLIGLLSSDRDAVTPFPGVA